jgi:bifunctional ADP-heptose synthase (sugar kinase/adenylyltransferase)
VLQAFSDVDAVVCFDEDTPLRLLDEIRPDVWVKGGDYSAADLPEEPLVRSWGGRVLTVPYLAGRSTTALVAGAQP